MQIIPKCCIKLHNYYLKHKYHQDFCTPNKVKDPRHLTSSIWDLLAYAQNVNI